VRKAQSTHPKFYFFDIGVKRALERTLDVTLKPKTYAFGAAFEHWVLLEAFRLNQILRKDFALSYFRTRDVEIDLILSKPRQEILVEIKSSDRVDPMKVKQFSELAKDFMPAQAYWLSLDPTPQKIENVRCLPWREGLEEIMGGS
jgi:predicted AAA+ superfamily ATPase